MASHSLEPYTGEQHASLDRLAEEHGILVISRAPDAVLLTVHVMGDLSHAWQIDGDGEPIDVPPPRRIVPTDTGRLHGPGDCHGAMAGTDTAALADATGTWLYGADLCPCGTYRIGDCASIGWGAR